MSGNTTAPEALIRTEQSVLGGILLNPYLLGELTLQTVDFVSPRHQYIWAAMCNLAAEGTAIDVVTVGARLELEGRYDAVGGHAYLGDLALNMPTVSNVHDYARLIRDEAMKRRVVELAGDIIERFKKGDLTGRELLDEHLASLQKLDQDEIRDDTRSISELTREHVAYLEAEVQRREKGASLTGYTTGVAALDEQIGGWPPGIISVVCARPAMGKSTLLLATADEASRQGIGVHVFSMEDPRKMYMNRALARRSGVPINRISTCALQRSDLPQFANASAELSSRKNARPWLVDDRSGLTASEIVRAVRRHRKSNGTKLVIVDYLQLVKRNQFSRAKNRHEELTESLHELADAAKNDGMAYIVASQLNRGIESREDKRPHESDLRESGTIEERSKCIVGLYRGAKYSDEPQDGVDLEMDGSLMSKERLQKTVQLLILKNSQGPAPGRVVASWDGERATIL